MAREVWAQGDAYEMYVGRWSRVVADRFVRWLGAPSGQRWLDVGCGTGALTETVLAVADPAEVTGVDPSEGFLATARIRLTGARFLVGDARLIPVPDNQFDSVVSGLMLNFVPEHDKAIAEMVRVAAPDAVVAAYVWDYADGMQVMRYFWDAAAQVDPEQSDLDEGRRFPICAPEPLRALWTDAGFTGVSVTAIEIPTEFTDFDDYWRPFLGGQGAAPAYAMALPSPRRDELRDLLRERLPFGTDGRLALTARAWAVKGTVAE